MKTERIPSRPVGRTALDVPCPTCRRQPGSRCVRSSGFSSDYPHATRVEKAWSTPTNESATSTSEDPSL